MENKKGNFDRIGGDVDRSQDGGESKDMYFSPL